jgi:HSP20 family molecular chaperone IbpA
MQEFEHSIVRPLYEFFSSKSAPFRLRETEQGFALSAAVPGFRESEIEIRAEPRRLLLHGKHEESTERKGEPAFEEHKEFTRWFDFPSELNPEKVKALFSNGVLEVTPEKSHAAKKIEVKAALSGSRSVAAARRPRSPKSYRRRRRVNP